jgi:Cu+-exporting ATPase
LKIFLIFSSRIPIPVSLIVKVLFFKDISISPLILLYLIELDTKLLTGDNEITANYVAKKLDIDKVYSQVLPDEKYKVIIELQKDGKVMFVGDGINDSPSIKQADIGITLNSGSDITKDAGDIILINNELKAVLKSINLSIESMKIIKQNLFWAFIYNIGGIPLAAGVFYPIIGVMLTPMYAGIAMSFSSVTVVLNSLRLKLKKI